MDANSTPNTTPNTNYPARVADWTEFCQQTYDIPPEISRLVACALLHTYPSRPFWLILESYKSTFLYHLDEYLRERGECGVDVGRMPFNMPARWVLCAGLHDLAWMRVARQYTMSQNWQGWVENRTRKGANLILHETEWTRKTKPRQAQRSKQEYERFVGFFVRGRMEEKASYKFSDAYPEMRRRLDLVLDREFRRSVPTPYLVGLNQTMGVYVDLLEKLNPELNDRPRLEENLGMLASTSAVLEGRRQVEERDWWLVVKVMRWSVRKWTMDLLAAMLDGDGHKTVKELVMRTRLSREVVLGELGRLEVEGLVDWPRNVWMGRRRDWAVVKGEWAEDLRQFVEGGMRWW